MQVNDKATQALAMALKFREMKQEVISSNIANAETPGYKSKVIDFEDALAQALDTDGQNQLNVSDPEHFNVGGGGFKSLEPEIYEEANGVVSEDGNTVDREAEMAKLAENKIMYDAAVQLLNKKMGLMKYAINQER